MSGGGPDPSENFYFDRDQVSFKYKADGRSDEEILRSWPDGAESMLLMYAANLESSAARDGADRYIVDRVYMLPDGTTRTTRRVTENLGQAGDDVIGTYQY